MPRKHAFAYWSRTNRNRWPSAVCSSSRPRGSLRPTHGHQGVRHRPRQRSQARRGRASVTWCWSTRP